MLADPGVNVLRGFAPCAHQPSRVSDKSYLGSEPQTPMTEGTLVTMGAGLLARGTAASAQQTGSGSSLPGRYGLPAIHKCGVLIAHHYFWLESL
jgi:hypothetical protein